MSRKYEDDIVTFDKLTDFIAWLGDQKPKRGSRDLLSATAIEKYTGIVFDLHKKQYAKKKILKLISNEERKELSDQYDQYYKEKKRQRAVHLKDRQAGGPQDGYTLKQYTKICYKLINEITGKNHIYKSKRDNCCTFQFTISLFISSWSEHQKASLL